MILCVGCRLESGTIVLLCRMLMSVPIRCQSYTAFKMDPLRSPLLYISHWGSDILEIVVAVVVLHQICVQTCVLPKL
jgi:hypothetical protein